METLSETDLAALARDAFIGLGLSPEDAADASSILVLADLFGITTHGVERILSYGERLRIGGINAAPDIAVEAVAPAMLTVDGDNGVGPLVGRRALDAAIAQARQTGVSVAFVRGSNHFGPICPYAFLAAEAGFASMVFSNATTTIPPWGGREARLGNNPLGLGVPGPGGAHVILDIALSVAARAKIRRAATRGEQIPADWATDAAGRPTTDPAEALAGFLQPIGGHKGSGLSVMVDMFAGMLSGAAFLTQVKSWVDEPDKPQNLGHFFLLLDIGRLAPAEELAARTAAFAGIVHDTPPVDPSSPVRLPGEIELGRLRHGRENGVAIASDISRRLREIAGILGT